MKKLIAAYICSVLFSFGALNADMRAWRTDLEFRYPNAHYSKQEIRRELRDDLAMNVGISLVPIINIAMAVFMTGLFVDGWTLDIGPLPQEGRKV